MKSRKTVIVYHLNLEVLSPENNSNSTHSKVKEWGNPVLNDILLPARVLSNIVVKICSNHYMIRLVTLP